MKLSMRHASRSQAETYHSLSAKERVLIRNEVDDDTEGQPYVRKREPGEDQREDVVLVPSQNHRAQCRSNPNLRMPERGRRTCAEDRDLTGTT